MADDASPPPPPRRRSAFGNALKVAHRDATAPRPRPATHVLTCPDCGAPRQGDDLACVYCGGKTTE